MANLDYDLELLYHLADPDSWPTLRSEGFREELIKDPAVLEIYQWAHEHYQEQGAAASEEVLNDEFEIEFDEPKTSLGDLIDRLRLRYVETKGLERLHNIGTQFKEDPVLLPKALIKHGKELNELLAQRGEVYGTGDFERTMERYHAEKLAGKGPSFGDDMIDAHTYGQRGVSIFLGTPKSGKSWWMVKGALMNAMAGVYPWLYALELPAHETHMRMYCMLEGVPWRKYIEGKITPGEEKKMRERSEELDASGVYKVASPPLGERSIDELVGRAQDAGAQVVFIDQLQYVEVDGKDLGTHGETGKFWEVLKRAVDLSKDIPICFAHQFNRTTKGAEAMPVVEQAKHASAVEETATLVLGLWASKEMRRSKEMQVGIIASRNIDHILWKADVELGKGCSIDITNVVEDE